MASPNRSLHAPGESQLTLSPGTPTGSALALYSIGLGFALESSHFAVCAASLGSFPGRFVCTGWLGLDGIVGAVVACARVTVRATVTVRVASSPRAIAIARVVSASAFARDAADRAARRTARSIARVAFRAPFRSLRSRVVVARASGVVRPAENLPRRPVASDDVASDVASARPMLARCARARTAIERSSAAAVTRARRAATAPSARARAMGRGDDGGTETRASDDGGTETRAASVRAGTIAREDVVHSRYLTVYDREIEFADEDGTTRSFAYDVVGHPRSEFRFVCVAPFHSRERTVSGEPEFTIIREYAQGSNSECVVLPSGCFEPGKHESLDEVAREELQQESRLRGGTLMSLLDDDNPGLLETKWCRNRCFPFLNIDGEECNEGERDAEEFNMTHERVTARELKRLMYGGVMMMPSVVTAQLAIDKLMTTGHLNLDDIV